MTHSEVQSRMADYLEGDLGLIKRALVDAHLDDCEACSRDLSELRRTVALLHELPDPEPPARLVEDVMRRVRNGEGRTSPLGVIRDWLTLLASPRIALPVSAVAVGLLLASDDLSVPALLDVLPGQNMTQSASPANRPRARAITVTSPVLEDGLRERRSHRERITAAVLRQGARSLAVVGPAGPRVPSISIEFRAEAQRTHRGRLPPPFVLGGPVPAESARAEQKHQELERRLDHLTREPIEFADEFAAYSVTEQEIWLRALAEHAQGAERGAEALDALRLAGDPRALEVATAFAAELRRVGAEARAAVALASPTR